MILLPISSCSRLKYISSFDQSSNELIILDSVFTNVQFMLQIHHNRTNDRPMKQFISLKILLLCCLKHLSKSLAIAKTTSFPLLESFFQQTLLPALQSNETWQKSPRVWHDVKGCDSELFSFEDAIAGANAGYLERAVVAKSEDAQKGNWVSDYAPSYDKKDLMEALHKGTLFFNGAGLDYPSLAQLADLSQSIFELPANINVYMTKPQQVVSVSPHTDNQDVIIFQTQGRKRWRVWSPPTRVLGKDPFSRGKRGDRIDIDLELGDPMIDEWLEPGSVLYVPLGFPHATSTEEDNEIASCNDGDPRFQSDDISCHVTLNLDTYFYGLCFATLRAVVLVREGTADPINPVDLDDEMHSQLFSPLPLGTFLRPTDNEISDAAKKNNNDNDEALVHHILGRLKTLNEKMAQQCGIQPPPDLGSQQHQRICIQFFMDHWKGLLNPTKYLNVRPPPPHRFSPDRLEAKMIKDDKNRREESQLKKLGAFATKI